MVQPANRRLVTEAAQTTWWNERKPDRGRLPNGTNIDNVSRIVDVGAWQLMDGNSYEGLPDGVTMVGSPTLEVSHSFYTASIVQRLTVGSRTFMRGRASANSWAPWQPVTSTRYTLPDGANLDDMCVPVWCGTWHIAASNSYDGMPEELNLTQAATLIVNVGNELNASTQMLLQGTASRLDFWVRELYTAPHLSNPNPVWHPWRRLPTADEISDLVGDGGGLVRSGQIARVIASTNPAHPLTDGDLLIVYT